MSARLTTEFRARALMRRVHDGGGSAMVLARGDAVAGGVLVIAQEPGGTPAFYERGIGAGGTTVLIRTGPETGDDDSITAYWQRRRTRDPDLWVIELIVAGAERFAAETIAGD